MDDFTDPWKEPETVVLQHGNAHSSAFFYGWVPTIARHYRLIRPNLRGFGGSTLAPPNYRWSLEGFVSDLERFLDALGLDRVHYIGMQSGGMIGWGFAYYHPERFKTLTIFTIPAKMKSHRIVEEFRLPEVAEREGVAAAVRILPRLDKTADPAYLEWRVRESSKTPKESYLGAFQAWADLDIEDYLPKIQVPTLLVTGEKQASIVTVQEYERIRDLMPRAKLVAIPGGSITGLPQLEAPDKCAQAVLEFIREQEAG